MKYLLDTHALLWSLAASRKLGPRARKAITHPDNLVLASAASAWEIDIKRKLGKPEAPRSLAAAIQQTQRLPLPMTVAHAEKAGDLPLHHADPFDRALIAQAQLERLTLITDDKEIGRYDVPVLKASA